jgi:hypothetical protein
MHGFLAGREGDRDLPREIPVDRPAAPRKNLGELGEQRDATQEVWGQLERFVRHRCAS